MKTIILLRHAKSSRNDTALADFDRPLAPRGKRACETVIRALRRLKLAPDIVLCSTARRAEETLLGIAPALADGATVKHEKRLYLASAARLLGRLRELDDGVRSVLLIGHNPGLQGLAVLLAGGGNGATLARLVAKFPTAGLAALSFPGKRWGELAAGSAELVRLWSPNDDKGD
ncbi:MAG TPA: histidine phosphatase family protein [Alphaproteobacteria bacterium]|nr:histidine phosphatase family protein [Alphaproteobacteria bacterium]